MIQFIPCSVTGGMAEWSKAAVLKTVGPWERVRGFESYSLRQYRTKETHLTTAGLE
jgi:hypothetical protein